MSYTSSKAVRAQFMRTMDSTRIAHHDLSPLHSIFNLTSSRRKTPSRIYRRAHPAHQAAVEARRTVSPRPHHHACAVHRDARTDNGEGQAGVRASA
jgi:hypothetical protein